MQGRCTRQYVIQTKLNSRDAAGARGDIDRILKELQTDYIDALMIHASRGDWTTRFRRRDGCLCRSQESGQDSRDTV
jgi:aryl-alcohol dehydrogenase-like predicted oxidoreductase